MPIFLPRDEKRRLAVLRDHQILDTPPESRFDEIVERASIEFEVPIALFTIIDESRQWFKSRIGLDVDETDRSWSMCSHAVAINASLVVEDTRTHPTFNDNPLVTGPPSVRFYAGVPVRVPSGEALGALCIVDNQPRQFSWSELGKLESLAQCVESEVNLRRHEIWKSRQEHH